MPYSVLEPSYYSRFACLADACQYSCCEKWGITFSKSNYDTLRSKHLPPAMREVLRRAIRRTGGEAEGHYAEIVLDQNLACPLLRDGLCSLQKTCGERYLPDICRSYPRLKMLINDTLVRCCGNSCEAVLALLLEEKQGLVLSSRPATANEAHECGRMGCYLADHPMRPYLEPVIITFLTIMQNRAYTLPQRMLLVGMAARSLETIMGSDHVEDTVGWITKHAPMASGDAYAQQLPAQVNSLALGTQNCLANLNKLRVGEGVTTALDINELAERLRAKINISINMAEEKPSNLIETELDLPYLQRLAAHLDELLAEHPRFMENLMVNHMMGRFFPFSAAYGANPYDSYMALCNDYAMFRLAMMAYAGESGDMSDAMRGILLAARLVEHSSKPQKLMVQWLHDNQTDTLAHMAYLMGV